MTLTFADIERWNAGDVREVFHAATSRAQAVQDAANGLATLPAFATWGGEAAEAAKEAIGKTRADLDAHGREALAVANAARSAADEIERIKSDLATVKADAAALGMEIDPVSGRVVAGPGFSGNPMELLLKQEQLQPRVDKLIGEANLVDAALANAIDMAGGSVPIPEPPSADGPNLDSLLGSLTGDAAASQPPEDSTPAGPDVPSDGPLEPTNLGELLGAPPSAAVPVPLNPRAVDEFKSVAREVMKRDGVPADQIERRLNEMVMRAQQPLPRAKPPEPGGMPAPGFAEGFGDRWFATEQLLKDLTGQEGVDALKESWSGLVQGLNETVTDPVGTAVGEVQNALNSPSAAYYLGEKTFDVGASAATLPFGGEFAAVRAGLPAELVTPGGAPAAVLRGWDPTGGLSAAEFESLFGTPTSRIWPDNNGFPPDYVPQPAQLPEGTIIDRFGYESGRYLAPDGTPFADRALTPESVGGDYKRYLVTGEPLPPGWQILQGPVEPWFGQTPAPNSTQYMIVGPDGVRVSVEELVDRGILDRYGPPLGR
jgi:hypothetical protein